MKLILDILSAIAFVALAFGPAVIVALYKGY